MMRREEVRLVFMGKVGVLHYSHIDVHLGINTGGTFRSIGMYFIIDKEPCRSSSSLFILEFLSKVDPADPGLSTP